MAAAKARGAQPKEGPDYESRQGGQRSDPGAHQIVEKTRILAANLESPIDPNETLPRPCWVGQRGKQVFPRGLREHAVQSFEPGMATEIVALLSCSKSWVPDRA